MLISTALVAMMTPAGLALFYGGMTPKRNVLNTVGMSYMSYAVGSVVWVMVGYTLAFAPTVEGWGIIGGLERAFMAGVRVQDVHGTIPEVLYVAFQGTFAAIAVALISGSVIERVKFSSWIVFTVLWLVLVYSPVAHWVWAADGFMYKWGVLDFAGGNVIHIAAGVSGLVFAILLGPRQDTGLSVEAYSLKFTVLGSALLWFGWFGFNGGSELAADAVAANAVLVTNLSAAFGVIGWMLLEWLFTGRYTLFGAASGAVAGLVAITPGSGFVNASSAMVIGVMGGLIGYFGVYELKKRTKVDDALDAFGVHALVGFWGCIATGIFADPDVNALGTGLWNGNANQLGVQAISALIVVLFSAVMTVVVYYATKLLTNGVRVDAETERLGIDQSFHGESAGSA
jgi:Amt family ammonium transporter